MLLALCLLPIPVAYADEGGGGGGGDSGGGGGSTTNYYVTVNGGQNSLEHADSVDVSTSITNITADNVTVYVEGDYNPVYLYHPKVTELHMINNENGALWNPKLAEIPTTLHAAVMKQAKVSILYDGWIDLEHVGANKPYGATREAEILGYDIYAKLGEQYEPIEEVVSYDKNGDEIKVPVGYIYSNGGIYGSSDTVNYMWAIMQLYRAIGVEQVQYYVYTEGREPDEYNINESPLAQFLTMSTNGPDLSAVISHVAATRTDPDMYLNMAQQDGLLSGMKPIEDAETQGLTVGEFCVLAYTLMHLYGEPVITDQETYMLLEAYGRELPYGLPSIQLEAVKYLLARGIIETDLDWRADLDFSTAATILMRIKDEDSRLTFKEIQLTAPVDLLAAGYYPTTVASYQAPVEVLEERQDYTAYTTYDYFVEVVDSIQFKSEVGGVSIPFMCNGVDNVEGVLDGTAYMGRVNIDGHSFYHFQVEQDSVDFGGTVNINTAVSDDLPYRYALPAPAGGNVGGFWLYTGDRENPGTETISEWQWYPLDHGDGSLNLVFPSEYADKARKEQAIADADTQLALFTKSTYGFTIRVDPNDLDKVKFKGLESGKEVEMTLGSLTRPGDKVSMPNDMSIERSASSLADKERYVYFTVTGCDNKNTLTELFTCEDSSAYQSFPAFSKNNDQYLVAVDYLKSIGVIWEFTTTGDHRYYIGVKTDDLRAKRNGNDTPPVYTDVYIGAANDATYVIRGSQLTLYPGDHAIVWESDNTYYVDYAAILGIQKAVSFKNSDGTIALTPGSQIDFLSMRGISTPNNNLKDAGSKTEWLPTVSVETGEGTIPYIYAPVTYALANWIVVDNKIDMRTGIFSFFANPDADAESEGAKGLESMLGVSTNSVQWDVYYTSVPPLGSCTVAISEDGKSVSHGAASDILYMADVDAYLIKPTVLGSETYGQFSNPSDGVMDGAKRTSIVYRASDGFLADWNYNLYSQETDSEGNRVWSYGYAVHQRAEGDSVKSYLCDVSGWTGDSTLHEGTCGTKFIENRWIPAPVGIPGLLGYPASLSFQSVKNSSVDSYSGVALTIRGGKGNYISAANLNGEVDRSTRVQFSIIHATPSKTWVQTCGFTFEFLAGSPLGEPAPTKPRLDAGGASAGFDWEQFFHDIGIQNADDWLTIAIIAVLNILPRIFMFAFIILMGLSLIANVKPWQAFCDSVFDPYKLLTFGRQDVHTIKLKMVILYSIIALALFGLFQNGIILEVIAWVARAVTGILSR